MSAKPEIFQALLDIDTALAQKGVHTISDYWKNELDRFYNHSSATQLIECVGRGGAKTTTMVKAAIAETLAGGWKIPPGEVHYYTICSENKQEAVKTLKILRNYLKLLHIKFTSNAETIELLQYPYGFKVLAARIGAVSGWRCISWTADELSKWTSDDGAADPASEVISSLSAMTVTHAEARGHMISSPLGTTGFFYDCWALGNTNDQMVGHAPSWIANPGGITEAQTKSKERVHDRWLREYAAQFISGGEHSLFSASLLERCTRAYPEEIPVEEGVTYAAAQDPGFTENPWTFVITGRRKVGGRVKRSVILCREWQGNKQTPLQPFYIFKEIASLCRKYDIQEVSTDQYQAESLQAIAARPEIDLYLRKVPTTHSTKLQRYESLLTMLVDDEIELAPVKNLREDLLGVRRVVTSAGMSIREDLIGSRHSDFAPALALAIERTLIDPADIFPKPGSPEYLKALEQLAEEQIIKRLENERTKEWWEAELE
jgi:hypothetical protein